MAIYSARERFPPFSARWALTELSRRAIEIIFRFRIFPRRLVTIDNFKVVWLAFMESIWIGYLRISNEKPEKHFKYLFTLVPEVFLDFSTHERTAREPRSVEHVSRSGEKEKLLSPLREKKKNQEKRLGPGYYLFCGYTSVRLKHKISAKQ